MRFPVLVSVMVAFKSNWLSEMIGCESRRFERVKEVYDKP